jgi:outer membrane protein assembly factor BamD (BamD/ComL family)
MKSISSLSLIFVAMLFLVGCGKTSPEEYMAKATAARDSSKFGIAIEQYRKLVKDHPASVLAEEAMFQIAVIQNDNLHDYPAAIASYKEYAEKYPGGKRAPLAMFLTGYIYNNELHDLPNAKLAYESFLAKFPNHEMAQSAKFEIANLGKPPEELLKETQPKEEKPQVAVKPEPKKRK